RWPLQSWYFPATFRVEPRELGGLVAPPRLHHRRGQWAGVATDSAQLNLSCPRPPLHGDRTYLRHGDNLGPNGCRGAAKFSAPGQLPDATRARKISDRAVQRACPCSVQFQYLPE